MIYSDQSSRIIGWDVESGEQVIESPTLTSPTYDESLAINPAGTEIAIASVNGGLKIWSLTGDTSRFQTSEAQTSLNYTTSVAYSPDGSQLVTLEYAGLVQVWDAQTGEEVAAIRDYAGNISTVKLTPDQQQVFTADQTGAIRFYDLRSGEEVRRFDTHANLFRDLADLSADGSLIVYSNLKMRVESGSFQSTEDDGVTLIDAATGEVRTRLAVEKPGDGLVYGFTYFSLDGQWLMFGGLNGTWLWDTTREAPNADELLTVFSSNTITHTAAFSRDGQSVAFGISQGATDRPIIAAYDVVTLQDIVLSTEIMDESAGILAIDWSPDNKILAILTNGTLSPEGSYTITLFAVETQQVIRQARASEYVYDLAYSPDGSILAVTVNGRVTLYDAATLDVLAEQPQSAAYLVNFSADGSMLLTGGWDGIVRVWGVTE